MSVSMEADQLNHSFGQVERDKKAKLAGFVIALPGELYILTLSRTSTVYIEKIGKQWEAWRETYQTKREKAVAYKMIASSETFEVVLFRAKSYFEYIRKQQA